MIPLTFAQSLVFTAPDATTYAAARAYVVANASELTSYVVTYDDNALTITLSASGDVTW